MLLEITLINDEVLELVEDNITIGDYMYLSSEKILMWEQDYFEAEWLHPLVEDVVNFVNKPIGDFKGV